MAGRVFAREAKVDEKREPRIEQKDGYWTSGLQRFVLRAENGSVELGAGATASEARKKALKTVRRMLKELEAWQ